MPPLANARHERFAQELAKGKSATEAMAGAGYSDPRNSTRLTKKDEIARRVAELKAGAAARTELTVASLTEDLLRIAKRGEELGEAPGFAVARAALMDAAKLNGLIVDRSENVNINHDISAEPLSETEWEAQHASSTEH